MLTFNKIALPVGSTPDDLDAVISHDSEVPAEEQVLHSIPESSVIFQSLKQSREKWLSTFPKFSALKARGSKIPAIVPPAHHSRAFNGRVDLTIGPHIFPGTMVYEIIYLPSPTPATLHPSAATSTGAPSSSQPAVLAISTPTPPLSLPASVPVTQQSFITPPLVQRIWAAAETNPTLKTLLLKATTGKASQDEIDRIGLLIEDLGVAHEVPPPVKDFDIVFEVQERPLDRLLLPRGPVVCEVKPVSSIPGCFDLDMQISVPVPAETDGAAESQRVVPLHWSRVTPTVKDLFFRWVGGDEKMAENKKILAGLKSATQERKYLQYQLPDGAMLTSVQNAVAPAYTTRSIKPSQQEIARRRRAARKAIEPAPKPVEPAAKKKRVTKANQLSTPQPIACHSCGQTDVPLLMGGRFCRTCMDAGKGVGVTPFPASSSSRAIVPHATPALQVRMYTPPNAITTSVPTTAHSPYNANNAGNWNGQTG